MIIANAQETYHVIKNLYLVKIPPLFFMNSGGMNINYKILRF